MLLELNREVGSALVVVTHNDRLAAAMERTLRLDHGRVHEESNRPSVRQGGTA
jgi:predicted ABC-type transport system involved in lysophospholipase L1 biosynthesis ATPase subunit